MRLAGDIVPSPPLFECQFPLYNQRLRDDSTEKIPFSYGVCLTVADERSLLQDLPGSNSNSQFKHYRPQIGRMRLICADFQPALSA
jgi:hypothetical protein